SRAISLGATPARAGEQESGQPTAAGAEGRMGLGLAARAPRPPAQAVVAGALGAREGPSAAPGEWCPGSAACDRLLAAGSPGRDAAGGRPGRLGPAGAGARRHTPSGAQRGRGGTLGDGTREAPALTRAPRWGWGGP